MLINLFKRKIGQVIDKIKKYFREREMRKINIKFVKPNYLFIDKFNCSSTVIDVGCGYDADLSVYLIKEYNLRSFGVDPTRKHAKSLKMLSKKTKDNFQFFPLAVTAENGKLLFNESAENVSGSILQDHINVKQDTISSYEVESVTLNTLLSRLDLIKADYLKLDIEGAEYELITNIDTKILEKFDQIFIEFHHHCIDCYSVDDTKRMVEFLKKRGLKAFTLDNHNYLFYKK